MAPPFRFGLHFWELPLDDWRDRVQRYERLGFSSVTFTDHLVVPQWEPFTGLSAVAAVTERLRVGTLVLDAGIRNPVVIAKSAATIHRLSGGRFELGLGAGYVAANFAAAGLPFDAARDRLGRLEEEIAIILDVWSQPTTTFHGRFYDIVDAPLVGPDPVRPPLLVGGGGPATMRLAGRVADIVSMIPRQSGGEWSVPASMPDSTRTAMAEKAAWAREAAAGADRDPQALELNTMVFAVAVGDDPAAAIDATLTEHGITRDQAADSSLFLLGTGDDVCEQLLTWREATGISYISLFDPGDEQIEYLAEKVVAPLSSR